MRTLGIGIVSVLALLAMLRLAGRTAAWRKAAREELVTQSGEPIEADALLTDVGPSISPEKPATTG